MFENKDIIIDEQSINCFKEVFESIKSSDDFEEIQRSVKSRTGNPLRVVYLRSKKLNQQIIMIPVYNRVIKKGKVVGYDLLHFVGYVRDYAVRTTNVFTILSTIEINSENVVIRKINKNV